MTRKQIEVKVEGGSQGRLEDLHAKVLEAAEASGLDASAKKGPASASMSVHTEPHLIIDGKPVARPEALTVTGIAKLMKLAADGAFESAEGPLTLPFANRFRETEATAEVGGAMLRQIVDDATGVVYLAADGALTPLLSASGAPQRAW